VNAVATSSAAERACVLLCARKKRLGKVSGRGMNDLHDVEFFSTECREREIRNKFNLCNERWRKRAATAENAALPKK
jgi:hypothetical protein